MNPLPTLYPLFLKVDGRRTVVVGGGPIGAQKAGELLAAGASVTAISPVFAPAWDALGAEFPQTLNRIQRKFSSGDLVGASLAFSATNDPAADAQVWEEGKAQGVWVNVVDVPERCDFYAGSVIRRGALQILIGTAGASPSLAIAVRQRIESALPRAVSELADVLWEARPELKRAFPDFRQRAEFLNRRVGDLFRQMVANHTDVSRENLQTTVRSWTADAGCQEDCA